jgi:L-lysine 6-transaminase
VKLEKQAIKQIEDKIKKDKTIGAIMIDTIIITDGLQFFRREFMAQLRDIATQHNLLLIGDETLTGMRTGEAWAFRHYEGIHFEYDLIVFGKGLVVAGVAAHNKLESIFNFKE